MLQDMKMKSAVWRHLPCLRSELRLDITLKCGQSFRWRLLEPGPSWPPPPCAGPVFAGVLRAQLLLLAQDEEQLYWLAADTDTGDTEAQLRDYFQLDTNLGQLYQQWAANDAIFEKLSSVYPGVRILRQHPVENVFSFICSANNNISRISGMVEKLCTHYGDLVTSLGDEDYFSFPSPEQLSGPAVEARLRELGFGYRAKYIQQAAATIRDRGGADWLLGLRGRDYAEARAALLQLQGVGPKVADCILLMSLDQPGAVPVDTHMFNIAKQYLPHLGKTKTVTDRVYLEIGNHFRSLYGEYAGWAHSVLFSADLKHIQKSVENQNKANMAKADSDNVKTEKRNETEDAPLCPLKNKRKKKI